MKATLRGLLLAAVGTVMLTVSAVAQTPFDQAVTAYNQGDYATALRLWRPLAEQGSPAAQYNLGIMHSSGEGVPLDYSEAARLYRLAAEQGYASAQYNLGSAYYQGEGVTKNYAEAAKWFRLAAEQGIARA